MAIGTRARLGRLGLAVIALVTGCGRSRTVPGPPAMLSGPTIRRLQEADSISVYRLALVSDQPPLGWFGFEDSLQITREVRVDGGWRRRLIDLLSRPDTYQPIPKSCSPTPGVGVRFWGKGVRTDVAICFECCNLVAHVGPSEGEGCEFEPGAPALAALARQAFPDDPKVLALKGCGP